MRTAQKEVNWPRMESRIRAVLLKVETGRMTAYTACVVISDIVGQETGRGYEISDANSTYANEE